MVLVHGYVQSKAPLLLLRRCTVRGRVVCGSAAHTLSHYCTLLLTTAQTVTHDCTTCSLLLVQTNHSHLHNNRTLCCAPHTAARLHCYRRPHSRTLPYCCTLPLAMCTPLRALLVTHCHNVVHYRTAAHHHMGCLVHYQLCRTTAHYCTCCTAIPDTAAQTAAAHRCRLPHRHTLLHIAALSQTSSLPEQIRFGRVVIPNLTLPGNPDSNLILVTEIEIQFVFPDESRKLPQIITACREGTSSLGSSAWRLSP